MRRFGKTVKQWQDLGQLVKTSFHWLVIASFGPRMENQELHSDPRRVSLILDQMKEISSRNQLESVDPISSTITSLVQPVGTKHVSGPRLTSKSLIFGRILESPRLLCNGRMIET